MSGFCRPHILGSRHLFLKSTTQVFAFGLSYLLEHIVLLFMDQNESLNNMTVSFF